MARTTSTTGDALEPDALLLVGRIGKPHGVRGDVKVVPETDDPQRFSALETVYVGSGPERVDAYLVEAVRYQHSKRGVTVVLKLEGVDSRDEAEALRRLEVFAHEDDLPPLAEDEVFIHDLVGLYVVTDDGEEIGTVTDVLETPGQIVYVVERPDRPEALIPGVPEFIEEIDLDSRRLIVRPIEGLLE